MEDKGPIRRRPRASVRRIVSRFLGFASYAAAILGAVVAGELECPASLIAGISGLLVGLILAWLAIKVKYLRWDGLMSRIDQLTPLVKEALHEYAELGEFEIRNFALSESQADADVGWEWWLLKEGHGFTYNLLEFIDVS